jgi:hypothetical protein
MFDLLIQSMPNLPIKMPARPAKPRPQRTNPSRDEVQRLCLHWPSSVKTAATLRGELAGAVCSPHE